MRTSRIVLGLALTLCFTSAVVSQDPSANCVSVLGSLEITSQTDTTVEGNSTGDLEGTFTWEITATESDDFGPVSVTASEFDGATTTADGTVNTEGTLLQFSLMGMPGLSIVGRHVTGGDGAFEDGAGFIFGLGFMGNFNYFGFICTPTNPLR